jgi:hypothetical protein
MRWILIGILLGVTLSACANTSRFEKGPLVAHGGLIEGSQEPLYYMIWVDLKKSSDVRPMSSLLKLSPDSPPIALEKLRPEIVVNYLPPFTPPPQWPEAWKQKAKEDEMYAGNGFNIVFKESRLLSVGICSHCAEGKEHPIVGTPDGQYFYTLPLTERQVVEVFGSPDRIYKVGEIRY